MNTRIHEILIVSVLLSFGATGCLKSRLQLREEEKDSGGRAIPAEVQDVHPQGSAIDELKTELTQMTGRIEELERARKEAAQSAPQKDEFKKLESRMVELEQAQLQMLEALKKVQEPKKAAAAAPTTEGPEGFERAKAQYDSGDFDGAIENFSNYLKNPKAARLEDATFYRAESHFQLKQYQKAILDYSKFTEKYTRSRRLPAALLKIGISFESLGMKDDAKGFFQELVDKFPKSPEAKKARPKLK